MERIANSVVLITGGNKGIGFATAKQFLQKGASVIIAGRNEDKLHAAVEKLESDRCGYVVWDIADVASSGSCIDKAHTLFGPINVFINNAGIVTDEDANVRDFLQKTAESWDQTMAVNLKGMYFAIQAETKYMIEHSIRGHIVNVCSEMGFRPAKDAYSISKWGVRGMTTGLAPLLMNYGIVLNGIAPGETATEIMRQPENTEYAIRSPRGKRAMPYEIAEEIYFLATRDNIIGEILVSDGGRRIMY